MSSPFIRALQEIKLLCDQADVIGTPRMSLTFDSPHDRERFKAELQRQIKASGITWGHLEFLNVSQGKAYGIEFRIL